MFRGSWSRRGLSMVEMMFAVMILSVVLLGMLGIIGTVLRNLEDGRTYEKVSIAANSLFGQAGLALSENFEKSLFPDTFIHGVQEFPGLEGVSYEVKEERERDDLKRVEVTLFWKSKDGLEHKKTFMTKFVKGAR